MPRQIDTETDTFRKPSPDAAAELIAGAESYGEAEELMGMTDCPRGCEVEPDGCCPHGWVSAGRTAGLI